MPRSASVQRQFAPAIPARRRSARTKDAAGLSHSVLSAGPLPRVSLHLPICNEPPAITRHTLDVLSSLDYPDFEVLVIDSNTGDPALWEPVAEHCARLGPRFRFYHLGPWPGGKAGALNFGLQETAPNVAIVGVLNNGAPVRRDWLRRMVPGFVSPAVGFVWSPVGAAASPWVADVPVHADPNVPQPDSLILLRRSAVEAVGGWAEWSVAEDVEIGLRLLRGGWRGACCPESLGGDRQPLGFPACARERFRHAYGVMQASRAHLGPLLSPFHPTLTLQQRGRLLASWLPDLSDALCLLFLVAALAWSAGLVLDPRQVGFAAPPLTLVPVLMLAMTAARGWHASPSRTDWWSLVRAAVSALALSPAAGCGAWQAWLGGEAAAAEPPVASSALMQRLESVHRELVLLFLTWTAAITIAASRGLAEPGAWAWCGMLLIQSLPCAAAVCAALAARSKPDPQWISPVRRGALPR